jgi:putative membrane protein
MAERDFLTPQAQAAVQRAVADAEAFTSAEIVVAVRRASGRYREADYLCGFLVALAALLALLYLPQVFPLWVFVPDVALAFLLGALAGSRFPWLRRRLTPAAALRDHTRGAARVLFVDARYTRLPARNAVLVYVALFERHVEVVADLGIKEAALVPAWGEVCAALDGSLRPTPDLERFLAALRRLGALLGREHPRLVGDVNELPDAVSAS